MSDYFFHHQTCNMKPEELIGRTIEILRMAGGMSNGPTFPFDVGSKLVVRNATKSNYGGIYNLQFV